MKIGTQIGIAILIMIAVVLGIDELSKYVGLGSPLEGFLRDFGIYNCNIVLKC